MDIIGTSGSANASISACADIETSVIDGNHGNELKPPKEFYCPITQELLHDPVVCEDGHTYERIPIMRWLVNQSRSPITNETLVHRLVVPNVTLRKLIDNHRLNLGTRLITLCQNLDNVQLNEVTALLEAGSSLDVRDAMGNTALLLALQANRDDIAMVLIGNAASVCVANERGETPKSIIQNRQNFSQELLNQLQVAEQNEMQLASATDVAKKKERLIWQQQQQYLIQQSVGGSGAAAQFGPCIGFFPSLFGLQFQRITMNDVDNNNSESSAATPLPPISLGSVDVSNSHPTIFEGWRNIISMILVTIFGTHGAQFVALVKAAFNGSESAQQSLLGRLLMVFAAIVFAMLLFV